MKSLGKKALDWLYPRRCVFCDELLLSTERYLCKKCSAQIPIPPGQPRCMKCGKPMAYEEEEYCYDCRGQKQSYDWGIGMYPYEGVIKQSILRLKSGERKEYGEFLGKLMVFYGKEQIRKMNPEVIIPVPIHKKKRRSRGYNQAELLAIQISRGLSIPIRTDLVLRKKITKEQKKLGKKERQQNLKKAFQVQKGIEQYTRVLIVDDIYTTGNTVSTIAEKIKEAGTKKVYYITLCIGKGF